MTNLIHKFSNGITLLGEQMQGVSSAACSILVPYGAARDPKDKLGISNILAEMFQKGAGSYDTRELSSEFEKIGAQLSYSTGTEVSVFSVVLLAENLEKALELYATKLLEPRFPESELESIRQIALQELASLEDEPASKAAVELQKNFYPEPFGRSHLGTKESVSALGIQSIKDFYSANFLPANSIIGVAGKFDWQQVIATIEKHFSSWNGGQELLKIAEVPSKSKALHIAKDAAQVQIALAYPSARHLDPEYYSAKVAVGVLSGGMAGRLFIEVREKRGLVYRVSASHSAARGRAGIFAYAGTTPENAEETLSVIRKELAGLVDGVSEDELNRAKADLKSRIIMQGESSSMRASSLVNDWWNMGKVRTLDEVKRAIDEVQISDVAAYAKKFPPQAITLISLGSKELKL